jgi:hypothetical protein
VSVLVSVLVSVSREKIALSARRHRPGRLCPHTAQKERPMEAERSNAIRSQLEDLTIRVAELRRYL